MLTVNAAAANRKLTTLAAVKTELGIADSAQDEALSAMIDQMSAAVESFCNRVFAIDAVTESVRLPQGSFDRPEAGVSFLRLSRWPLIGVTSVTEDGTALALTDFEADFSAGTLLRLDGAGRRRRWNAECVVVVYSGGYKLPADEGRTLPFDIELATIEMVRLRYMTKSRDPSLKSINIPGVLQEDYWVGNLSENGAIPPMVAGLLEPTRAL